MVIKTFKLGTLNRYLHTKTEDGEGFGVQGVVFGQRL